MRGRGLFFVGADDEDGVVAGDGADHFGPVFVVDASGHGLRASGGGHDDEQVLRLAGFKAEAAQEFLERGAFFLGVPVGACGDGVS